MRTRHKQLYRVPMFFDHNHTSRAPSAWVNAVGALDAALTAERVMCLYAGNPTPVYLLALSLRQIQIIESEQEGF